MPPRLALFDCDGTLVDSQNAIVAAMALGFAAVDLPAPTAAAVRRIVGLTLEEAISRLLPIGHDGVVAAVAAGYRAAFAAQRHAATAPEPLYPGLVAALDALEAAGLVLGVATGKSRRGLLSILDSHGLTHRFVTLQTADLGLGKPHPAMVLRALAEAGADAVDTVMIGDTSFDMDMAGRAGVAALGVSWGYHGVAELAAAGAGLIVDDFAEVPAAVLSLLTRRSDPAP
jgi:phosphoglycolate phosphatase